MKSLDTNILIYAVNQGCSEHDRAKRVYESMLEEPSQWIVADQVLFEFYRALRNPRILARPLHHAAALHHIRFRPSESVLLHCSYYTRVE